MGRWGWGERKAYWSAKCPRCGNEWHTISDRNKVCCSKCRRQFPREQVITSKRMGGEERSW